MRKIVIFCVLFSVIFSAQAQEDKDILMTVGDQPVYNYEFINVYEKNLDLVKDETQKSVDGYLDLFIDYKLKVAEAYAQDLHKNRRYKQEFEKYRNQLSRNYIYDTQFTEALAIEAFERSKEEINADHILIKVGYESSSQDTLIAYNKISEARTKALAGEDFGILVAQYSEEPGAAARGGALGYFTAFSMVYPFESMAYNTPKGEISEIVRTSFGYHILKINDRRPASNEIIASHIMIATKEKTDAEAKKRIEEIEQLLAQGSDFASLAKEFSEDKSSGAKGGLLKKFKMGQLKAAEFEEAAYALKNIGDISKPVKTKFGWHLIRLEERFEPESYEEQKDDLMSKVERGDRSKVIKTSVSKKIIEKYGIEVNDYMEDLMNHIPDLILESKWASDTLLGADNKVLFTIGNDKDYYYNGLIKLVASQQGSYDGADSKEQVIQKYYKVYESEKLSEYFKQKLEEENPEYGAVITEYRDGLLIFDVMQKNVWQKATNDSVGVRNYYNQVKSNYKWATRIKGIEFSGKEKAMVEKARQLLEKGLSLEEIKTNINVDNKINILATERAYEKGDASLPAELAFKKGVTTVFKSDDSYKIIDVKEVLPAGIKTFEEVKGKILSEYQTIVEKQWMDSLRDKYEVKINDKQLKKVKKQVKK